MEDFAIEISNLFKIYKLYEKPIDRLKESLSFNHKNYHKDFYALDNINLKIKKGETVGIIGKNGAGKSTLLKIITGVLVPTKGKIKVNGKISSLLELGAGFNPEYTGIENIYLNGTLMGFSKNEIDKKIDSILEFADIGDFVYQPVKSYSSGMYVRLAFSVAINVEPDILIVDEALAVGDARFQAKCFKKISQLKNKGVTILFVTHDISTVKEICNKAILINKGKIMSEGEPNDVSIEYFNLIFPKEESIKQVENTISDNNDEDKVNELDKVYIYPNKDRQKSFGIGGINVISLCIKGINIHEIKGNENVKIRVKFSYDHDFLTCKMQEKSLINNLILGVSLADIKGNYIFGMTTYDKNLMLPILNKHIYDIEFYFKMPFLMNGEYLLNIAVAMGKQEDHIQLCWYDGIEVLKVHSSKKYIYGYIYNEYEVGGKNNVL